MDTENFPTAVFRLTTPVDLATLPPTAPPPR